MTWHALLLLTPYHCVQVHSLIHGFIHGTSWSDCKKKVIATLDKVMEIGSDSVPSGQGPLMGFAYLQAFRAKRFLQSADYIGDGALASSLPFSQLNKVAADVRDPVS